MKATLRQRIGRAIAGKLPRRAYGAARIDRLTNDWIFSHTSANREIKPALAVIRSRARELERDNPHARRFLSMVEANIVGRGFALSVKPVRDGDERAIQIRDKFLAWADACDVTGRMSKADIERLIARTVARDGEAVARLVRGASYPDGLGVQVLESDYIATTLDNTKQDGSGVQMGVEIDANGRAVALHMYDRNPGDQGTDTISIGQAKKRTIGEDVIHVYRTDRPGQSRAVSWFAPVMIPLRMLHGYQEAELVAARVASCQMGFYKIPPGEDYSADGKDGATGAPVSDAAPGTFERMPVGWEFQAFDPKHPTSQYGTFVKAILREIAGGLNVAYNNFANDLDGVSYSSIRSGSIEEREQWIVAQSWFSRAYLRPLFSAWLKSAAAAGTIKADDADQYAGRDQWTGRRWKWVDPASDAQEKRDLIAMGLAAPSTVAAENGDDFAEIQAQIRRDDEARKANGLPSITQPQAGVSK